MGKSLIEELRISLSDEKTISEFVESLKRKEDIISRHIEIFERKYLHRLDEIIEKISDKYVSDNYIDRYYRRGLEPREDLYWFLYEYAIKKGKRVGKFSREFIKNFSPFTSEMYIIGEGESKYLISRLDGQGSFIKIENYKE